jgi:hypothetical protein
MNKKDFMRAMERALNKVPEADHRDILYDYEEHFSIGKENGKTEEQICLELGNPNEIAESYNLRSKQIISKTNKLIDPNENSISEYREKKLSSGNSTSKYDNGTRVLIGGFSLAAGLLLIFMLANSLVSVNRISNRSNTKVNVGRMQIDKSGIHGEVIDVGKDGISTASVGSDDKSPSSQQVNVDSNSISTPEVNINEKEIVTPDVKIDADGISTPDMKIDSNGISAPGMKIDKDGISMPGVKIDKNGISLPGINIDKNGIRK